MAGKDYNEFSALIAEIRKPSRELLYNLGHKNYKNTALKQIVWTEIAEALSMDKSKLQTQWKSLRAQYKLALAKYNAPSGSARKPMRPKEEFLLKEMDFLDPYVEDDEPRSTTYAGETTASLQNLYDELAADPEIQELSPGPKAKKAKVCLESEVLSTLKKIENLSTKKETQTVNPDDHFYNFLRVELEKLPDEKQAMLNFFFIKQIFDA